MMTTASLTRRTLLAATATLLATPRAALAQAVPWSAGTEPAKLKLPEGATDCHHHIYDPKYPLAPQVTNRPGDALASDYRLLLKRLGIKRHVMVQASVHGTDATCLIDMLAEFGSDTRGVAMVQANVSDAELKRLHDKGVRGLRFMPQVAWLPNLEAMESLARRVAPMGWCIQIQAAADYFVSIKDVLDRIQAPLIYEHAASIPNPGGVNHPAFTDILARMKAKRAWFRISGLNYITKVGPPTYADAGEMVKAFVAQAPEQVLWASGWPHYDKVNLPDDAQLLDLLAEWAPDPAVRKQILVDSPARLFHF